MKTSFYLKMFDTIAVVSKRSFLMTFFVESVVDTLLITFDEGCSQSEQVWHNRDCVILRLFETCFCKRCWGHLIEHAWWRLFLNWEKKWHNRGCVILQTFCQMMCWICRRLFLEHFGELWCQLEVRWHNRDCVIWHDMEEVTLYFCSPYPPRLPGESLWDLERYWQVKWPF